MAKRRTSAIHLAAGLGLAGFHTGVTLWHRLPILAAAFAGGSRSDPELVRMTAEKAGALVEGAFDAQREAVRLMGAAAAGRLRPQDLIEAPARIAHAGLKPAFRRVRANTGRLSRKSLKRSLKG